MPPITVHIRGIVGTPALIFADTLPVQIRGMKIVPATWMSEYNRGSKLNVASNHRSRQNPLRSAGKANEPAFCSKLKEDEETSGEQVGDGQLVEDTESRPAGWAQKAHYS